MNKREFILSMPNAKAGEVVKAAKRQHGWKLSAAYVHTTRSNARKEAEKITEVSREQTNSAAVEKPTIQAYEMVKINPVMHEQLRRILAFLGTERVRAMLDKLEAENRDA